MQENKNNAVEKVENIASGKTNYENKSSVVSEEQKAIQREELARERAKQKAEKEKIKVYKLREKNNKKQQKQQEREAKRIAEEQKREMLKNQTAEERSTQKRLEKQAKIEARQAEKQRRAQIKSQKITAKSELKRQKENNRHKRKTQRRGYGGWLAAVIALGVSTIALASALTLTFLMPQEADLAMESVYSKSFYDTVEQVDNIDLNLSKVLATKDQAAIQTYLVDLAINSELAENDIQQLPLQDESKYYTTKLINQIGDYAKYLNKKLIDGQSLSSEDRQTLLRLYQANLTFKQSLQDTLNSMPGDFSFSSMSDGRNGNLVIENFNELQNLSVEYPELIYDGPFSDGLDRKEVKGLTGNNVTKAEAKEIFKSIFANYSLEDVKDVGETTAQLEAYNVEATVNGENLYAQISKKGGKLIMFAYSGSCKEVNYQDQTATQTAEEFINSLGIQGMKPVWINLANNVYTINFAYEQDGVVVYSDLIKVRVCAETNMVIGLEASSYWINHTERVVQNAAITRATAQSKVWDELQIESSRLALVPIGQATEKLCYEFSGEYNDSTYYVYIDAITGRQVEMFKVIESTEGTLLM